MSPPPHPLSVWWDAPADGPTNMALDEALADAAAARDAVLVRVSTWERPGISLGAFQRAADARACEAAGGLEVVRRPSGGGAIVHGSDVTLAVAVPRTHPLGGAAQDLYDAAHQAMVDELVSRGVPARLSVGGPAGAAAGTPAGAAAPEGPFLCFDRRAVGDVVVPVAGRAGEDSKILGSAQRRLRGAVLQHGSLLLGANPAVGPAARHPGLAELFPHGGPWRLPEGHGVVRGWLERLATRIDCVVREESGPFQPRDQTTFAEAQNRLRSRAWFERR